jgi:NAD(P)-dependent dehydrogenase (short-subunit alcohol dehydrogenase family)
MEITGAVVLITGASSGIGAATARALGRAGASVALAARRRDELEAVAAGMRSALVVPTDLAKRGAAQAMVEATIARFGRIDVLINNAAAIAVERSDAMTAGNLRATLQTNFLAAVEAANAALPAMRKQGRGLIINVSSPGAFVALPLMAAYAGSKAALSGWTRTAQAEWAGSGITVTEFLPGRVDTGSRPLSSLGEIGPEVFDEARRGWLAGQLLRPQRPDEVAERLVDCVRHPRRVVYSSPAARLAALVGAFPGLSRRLGARLAQVARAHLAVSVFTPLSAAPVAMRKPNQTAGKPPAPPSASLPGAAAAPERRVEGETPEPPQAVRGVVAPAAQPAVSVPPPAAKPVVKRASESTEREDPSAPPAAAAKGRRKAVAKKSATKKRGAAEKRKDAAEKKKGAAQNKTRRGLGDDDAARAPSPIMSERVRAAAERAAAAARAGTASAKRRGPNGDAGGGTEDSGS